LGLTANWRSQQALKLPSGNLTAARESNEVGTETESSALTGRYANRGREDIQERKDGRRREGEGTDLIQAQGLLGDIDGRNSNGQALQQILQRTVYNFANTKVHFLLYSSI
jgi:hypothetical protein